MKISAALLSLLLEFAESRGLSRLELMGLLEDANMDLCAPAEQVSEEEYLGILRRIVEKLNDPLLGLAYGCYLNLSALGVIHQISLAATSIEQAVLMLMDYLRGQFPLVQVEEHALGRHTLLELQTTVTDPVLKKQILDSTFSFVLRELCLMLPREKILPHLPHEKLEPYIQRLKMPIEREERTGFLIETAALDGKLNPRNLTAIEVLLPRYLQMIEEGKSRYVGFTLHTRNMILHLCAPELPTLSQVASQFAISERTFQRKLTAEGHAFRTLTNEIKKELAEYLKAGKKLKTQDIAYILGYSEPAAYLHAAKKW